MSEEKRIYVVVAETVQTAAGSIVQPCGRIAAQCAHVVSKMRISALLKEVWNAKNRNGEFPREERFKEFTTIILAVPDSSALEAIVQKHGSILTKFSDTNKEVYGQGYVLTAVCTHPSSKLGEVFAGLPLWSHGANL